MSTDAKIEQMIKSYRFTVIALSSVIILLFLGLIFMLEVRVPYLFSVALDDYFSDKEFIETQ